MHLGNGKELVRCLTRCKFNSYGSACGNWSHGVDMKHLILGAAFLIGMSAVSSMPAQAASQDSVVSACKLATSGKISGQCAGETQAYLNEIKGLPSSQLDKDVADLVFKLGQLAQGGTCNVAYDGELGAAIKLAGTYSSSKDQQGQIDLISTTVTTCVGGKTASIGGPGFRGNPQGNGNGGVGNVGQFPGGGSSLGSFFGGAGHKPSES